MYRLAVLPCDGVGPEVVREGLKVLAAAAQKYADLKAAFMAAAPGDAQAAAWKAFDTHAQSIASWWGVKNISAALFGLLGTWVYLLAIVLGPVLAGLLGARRTEPVAAPV